MGRSATGARCRWHHMVASEGALGELGWVGIDRDDPAVRELREALSQRAGSHSLEVVDAADGGDFAQRAAALFRRDGFVLVASVLDDERLRRIRAGLDVVVREMLERDPNMQPPNRESGLAGSHRYSIRDAAAVFGQHAAWAALVDPPALHEVLEAIWNSRGYICAASAYPNGGDFVLSVATHTRPEPLRCVLLAAAHRGSDCGLPWQARLCGVPAHARRRPPVLRPDLSRSAFQRGRRPARRRR